MLQSNFQFISPTNKSKKKKFNPQEYFKEYEIDIIFDVQNSLDHEYQVFTKIEINSGSEPLPGYKIYAEGTGLFRIDPQASLSDTHLKNLKNYSAVNLLLNRLRTHILQTTSLSAFGPYDLPPIDITDLFLKKQTL